MTSRNPCEELPSMLQASEEIARIARDGYLAQLKQLPLLASPCEVDHMMKHVDDVVNAAVLKLQSLYKKIFEEEVLPKAIQFGQSFISMPADGAPTMPSPFMMRSEPSDTMKSASSEDIREGAHASVPTLSVSPPRLWQTSPLPKLQAANISCHLSNMAVDKDKEVMSCLNAHPSGTSRMLGAQPAAGWCHHRSSTGDRRLTNNSDCSSSLSMSNAAADKVRPSHQALNMHISGQSEASQQHGQLDYSRPSNYTRLHEALHVMSSNSGPLGAPIDPVQQQMLMASIMQQQQMQQPDLQTLIQQQLFQNMQPGYMSQHMKDVMLVGHSNESLASHMSVGETSAGSNISLGQLMAALGSNDYSGPMHSGYRNLNPGSSGETLMGMGMLTGRNSQQVLPPRFSSLPPAVQGRILDLTKPPSVLKVPDFDEKVTNKMMLMVERYGEGECLAMLEKLAGRLKTKMSAMKNGPGYLDVAVSSHLDVLMAHRFSPKSCGDMKEYARSTLVPGVFEELGKAIDENPWLRWDVLDESIIHQLKKLPLDVAAERLAEVGIRSFRHVDNVSGCIKSILSSRNQYTVRPTHRDA